MTNGIPPNTPLTGAVGRPAQDDNNSITTAASAGYALLHDTHFLEKLSHFSRERIPERVVHAKGTGAFGVFEVTDDITRHTCADFLSKIGKKTEMLARFSTVGGEQGSADTARDPRGFALKFYTNEGNLDIVGNNIPVFFIRDPIKFPDFVHTQKRHPQTGRHNAGMFWDFFSLTPESSHAVTMFFTDRCTPKAVRFVHGFGTNTFMFVNRDGQCCWAKWHFKTNQGIENWDAKQATAMAGEQPDYSRFDLFDAIERKDFPSWTAYIQVMPIEAAESYRFDPFDTTKVWFHADYPLIRVGKFTLNRNPENFFTDIEQAAFCPGNMVPGFYPSPDRMLLGRMMSYKDAQRHRLGANFESLPVNRPKIDMYTNARDGFMAINNYGPTANYYPNSVNRHAPSGMMEAPNLRLREAMIGRHPFKTGPVDYVQSGELYRRVLSKQDKDNLISNIVGHISDAAVPIQYRQCAIFTLCDPDYGRRVADGLGLDHRKAERLAEMNLEQRVKETMP
jgi:catalase